MPGPPVTIGCKVTHTFGSAVGTITSIPQTTVKAGDKPLATAGAICSLVTSNGNRFQVAIGNLASTGVTIQGQPLVRVGDQIPSGPGTLTIVGPPAAAFLNDQFPP